VLRGAVVPDGHVVVADWRCDWVGLGLATMLAMGGRRVTLASTGNMAGQRIQQYVRDTMTAAARRARVEIRPTMRLFGVDPTAVFLQDVLTGEAEVIEGTSALVLAQGHVPCDALLEELRAGAEEGGLRAGGGTGPDAGGFRVLAAGDVLTPRTIEEAVLEGLRAAMAV